MNEQQLQRFVERFLESTNCKVQERTPKSITVKLSPDADKWLTNRPYYWGFVERTGAEPETMSFTFIWGADLNVPSAFKAIKETLTFGSRRLEQMFEATQANGKFVQLFEQPPETQGGRLGIPRGHAYSTWLCVNYKIEFICDMKQERLLSLGIHLSTGEIIERFHQQMVGRILSPRLPSNVHLRETISIPSAMQHLERKVENELRRTDSTWAVNARERMMEELERISSYYDDMLRTADENSKPHIAELYANRQAETRWQYEPRIEVNALQCGIFHLLD